MAADLDVPGFRECSRTPELISVLYHDGGKHAVAASCGGHSARAGARPKEKGLTSLDASPCPVWLYYCSTTAKLVGAIGFEPTTL